MKKLLLILPLMVLCACDDNTPDQAIMSQTFEYRQVGTDCVYTEKTITDEREVMTTDTDENGIITTSSQTETSFTTNSTTYTDTDCRDLRRQHSNANIQE